MDETREEMITRNLPLVTFVVNRMSNQSGAAIDREDAIAYGVEGLIQAVDSYDPARGATFASFAVQRIRGSVLDAIRRMDVLPRSLRKSSRDLERANSELAAQLGRWPTQKELAMRLGKSVSDLQSILGHNGSRIVSLERVMEDNANESVRAVNPVDEDEFGDPALALDRKASITLLDEAIGSLGERDRSILQMRYGLSMPFHEIGRKMELSESRVCQLHKRILSSLRVRLETAVEVAA